MSSENIYKSINRLNKKVSKAQEQIEEVKNREFAEKWDRKFINGLPDAAFAVIEKGYSKGGNKNARHLPHHNKNVKSATENSSVDLPHYRNALNRVGQIKSVLGKESDSVLRKKGASHLEKHRAVLKSEKAFFSPIELALWEECEELYNTNVRPLLENKAEEEENNK